MARWGVPIGPVVVVVVVSTVVACVVASVVATVLVVAAPLGVVTALSCTAIVAIVRRLRLVVAAMVVLALAPEVVAHLLAATQHRH